MMKEVSIAIISAFVSGFFSVLIVHLNNKNKLITVSKEMEMEKERYKNELQKISNEHIIEINKLQNKLDLKDKEMESHKLMHELGEKSKERDGMNPYLFKLMGELISDPTGTTEKLINMQDAVNKMNPKIQQRNRKK